MSADPYKASARGINDPSTPKSWNKYSYVLGDPINHTDRHGTNSDEDEDENDDQGPGLGVPPGPKNGPKVTSPFSSAYPECNKGGGEQEEANLWFVKDNYASATTLGAQYGVPADWILGWSAEESGYGSSSAASNNSNFFNEAPFSKSNPGWTGAITCGAGTNPNWACFASWLDSANAALDSKYETIIQNGIKNGDSASTIFQSVANAGFDPVGTKTNKGYGNRVQSVIGGVDSRINCLKLNGYIK